jgi:FkbM family methyltransferase
MYSKLQERSRRFVVTLKGLITTVRTTRNFWDAFFLKVYSSRRNITFRNGIKMDLNWGEYCKVRALLENLQSKAFTIEKVDDTYRVRRGHVKLARALFCIKQNNLNYIVCQLDDGLYSVESERIKMIVPLSALIVYFGECASGTYDCDYNNKVVLDVGGFCGETAVFFSSLGAKRVIVYEPVVAHHAFIRRNMTLNVIEAELHEEGIGEEDGIRTIHYKSADTGFGILSKGENELKIRVRNVADVIEESGADIGKFDCEGAEKSLINVPKEILRRIDLYVIEAHTPEIRRAVMDKFSNAGFRLLRSYGDGRGALSVLHFKKTPELSDIAEPLVAVSPDYVMRVH